MKANLLIAHGSKRIEATHEVEALTKSLQASNPNTLIQNAFLELAKPNIPTAIEQLFQKGARYIRVIPYFLVSGNHVAIDIPQILAAKKQDHPALEFEILPPLGLLPEMKEVLVKLILQN